MLENIQFAIFPYIAIFVCLAGCLIRARQERGHAVSKPWEAPANPVWRWIPWHYWLLVILSGHLLAFIFPLFWRNMVYHQFALITIEAGGVTIAVVGLIGLLLVLAQHLFSRRLIGVITPVDFLVLVLLVVQFCLGLVIIIGYRWSASWTLSTTTPYLWSLLALRPDPSFIIDMPLPIKVHIFNAWLFVLLVPFSNIRHVFTLPFRLFERKVYKSIWNAPIDADPSHDEARRQFLRGTGSLIAGGLIVTTGFGTKLLEYVFGPHLDGATESSLLKTRLERLHATTEQKELEYERLQKDFILVAKYGDLSKTTGTYFIDYLMRPALAFKGPDGLPLLISAKCTHLGCTVGNQVQNGKILCPCHVSYFDILTGKPMPGAPAKEPLPLLGWVVKDDKGQVVMSKAPNGAVTGHLDPLQAASYAVYIAKRDTEGRG